MGRYRFNDKKTSLSDIGLSKIVVNNPAFGNHGGKGANAAAASGEKAYDQAKTWLDSKDWETEIRGLDTIVTLARNDPDVSVSKIQYS